MDIIMSGASNFTSPEHGLARIRFSSHPLDFETQTEANPHLSSERARSIGQTTVAAVKPDLPDLNPGIEEAAAPVISEATAEAEVPAIQVEEELTPAQTRFEETILFLLNQPNLKFSSKNAGGQVKERLGYSSKDWNNVVQKLGRDLGIIDLLKNNPKSTRSHTVVVYPEVIKENLGQPFITQAIKDELAKLAEQDQEDVAEGTGAEDGRNGDVIAESRTALDGLNGHAVSRRVQRAMELDGGPKSGYRREVPMPDFRGDARIPKGGQRARNR